MYVNLHLHNKLMALCGSEEIFGEEIPTKLYIYRKLMLCKFTVKLDAFGRKIWDRDQIMYLYFLGEHMNGAKVGCRLDASGSNRVFGSLKLYFCLELK